MLVKNPTFDAMFRALRLAIKLDVAPFMWPASGGP